MRKEEVPTFEEWKTELLAEYGDGSGYSWRPVEDWLYNAKDNGVFTYRNVVYHVCEENHKRMFAFELGIDVSNYADSIADIEEGCQVCNTPVPDGIKMIALLEKL